MLIAPPPALRVPSACRLAHPRQEGVFLIEALLGILIFSLGILALIGMQATAISAQTDARYRTEASALAEKMINTIWVNVDRTSATSIQTSLAVFAHQTGGSNCNFSGTASGSALVTAWLAEVSSTTSGLPGTSTAMQQITVNTSGGGYNQVNITICWQAPKATTTSKHVVSTYVN